MLKRARSEELAAGDEGFLHTPLPTAGGAAVDSDASPAMSSAARVVTRDLFADDRAANPKSATTTTTTINADATTTPTPTPITSKKGPTSTSIFNVAEYMDTHELDGDAYVLGIDEAGRGSIVGSMIYTGSVVQLQHHDAMERTGAADSKALNDAARASIRKKLEGVDGDEDMKGVPSFYSFVRTIDAEEITTAMLGRRGKNLNTLSHEAAIDIIKEAVMYCHGKLFGVFVDTVGPPETYQRLLRGRFPHLQITVTPKADAKYPVVSAASIVAKTTRDWSVLPENLPSGIIADVGNGYPSDPRATGFVRTRMNRFFGFSDLNKQMIRMSWKPVMELTNTSCEEIVFEADVDPSDAAQQKLSFKRPPPKRADSMFLQVFGLKSTSSILLGHQ